MTACHSHIEFKNKDYFLAARAGSIERLKLTKTATNPVPMPPPAYFPDFDGSADENELLNWLESF